MKTINNNQNKQTLKSRIHEFKIQKIKNVSKTKLSKLFFLVIVLFTTGKLNAQNTFPATGSVGIGTTTPNSSSILEVKSTTKGMLTPRMTQAQRNAIASPATGLLIYQTDFSIGFYYYTGSSWTALNNVSGLNNNLFIGLNAGVITTGIANVGIGKAALNSNTSGTNSVAIGDSALYGSTSAIYNTAIGDKTLKSNLTGSYNVATGPLSLYSNTIGHDNVASGMQTLYLNTTGSDNTAIGSASLYYNTTGNQNTALGRSALFSNTTGSSNTAIGYFALVYNTTGINNSASGNLALKNNTGGGNNTATGSASLYNNLLGENNTATGRNSLFQNTSGSYNTAVGKDAGLSNTVGSYNTFIGYNANGSATISNSTAIGYNASVTASNCIVLGNGSQNVGIGMTAPAYKLDVCGTIRAKEIRVETGWCDYVFANDYKLRPLSEVESYINENKHLPDVTAGPVIEGEGLEVGKVSSQMIRKIEELTLYVIKLQKQVDALKNSK